MKLLYPYRMIGEYEDKTEIIVDGMDEEDCMYKLISHMEKHGNLTWYSAVTDDEYIDGECRYTEDFLIRN